MPVAVNAVRARTPRRLWGGVLAVVVVVMAVAAAPTPGAGAAARGPGSTVENGPPVGTVSVVDHRGLAAPGQIVAAANGDLWFLNGSSIGRITMAGEVTIFADPGIKNPLAIAAGSDGNAWFTNSGGLWGSTVGRITPSGVVTTFPIDGQGHAIVAGADGALWTYMELGDRPSAVYRLTTDGVGSYTALWGAMDGWDFDETSRLAAGADGSIWYDGPWGCTCDPPALCSCVGRYFEGVVHELAPGRRPAMVRTVVTPDGDLWFTSGDAIGRMHPDGEWTVFQDAAIHDSKEITVGPDGALWFTNGDASIGRITLDGVVSSFTGAGIDHPRGVAAGADGAVWFTNVTNAVGRITPGGAVTTFTHPGIVAPGDPVLGADGALWFPNGPSSIGRTTDDGVLTVFTDARIGGPSELWKGSDGNLYFWAASGFGQIAPDGTFSYFSAPPYPPAATPPSFPDPGRLLYENVGGSTLGPDGNQWMTVSAHVDYRPYKPVVLDMAAVVRLSPAGVRTYFPLPDLDTPGDIVVGPDGNLWFADGTIARITTAGEMTFFLGSGNASDIAVGPDGALWYVAPGTDTVGRITTSGAVTSFADPSIHGPHGIASGPHGSLWFANGGTATLGRIQAATPFAGSAFHPLVPRRILDSRGPTGGWGSKLVAGSPRALQVAGVAGVPVTATAVVVNVTATGSDVGSFLSVSPGGGSPTNVSNLNFAAGETIPNLVTTKLGATGSVVLATALGSVDVVADVVGFYDDGTSGGGLYRGVTPARLLDSRGSIGGWNAPLTTGAPRTLQVRQPGNAAGVPPTATAVIANVTVTEATHGSFLSVWPSGVERPTASNLNFGAGRTIANLVIVGIGADGAISFANAMGEVDVVVDVVGYFDPSGGSRFHPVAPTRVLDDRIGLGLAGAWGTGQTRQLPVAGASGTGVPAGATGVVMNLTATNGTAGSFVTAYPGGALLPGSSNLNFGPGQTIPNLVTVALPGDGTMALANAAGTVDLIGDVTGYYAST